MRGWWRRDKHADLACGAAWESNPPSAGLRRITGFEGLLVFTRDAAWPLRSWWSPRVRAPMRPVPAGAWRPSTASGSMAWVRRRVAWTLVLPALVGGEMLGHSLAYRIVAPDASKRELLLERTGHAYLAYLHPIFGVCLALVVAALGQRVVAGFRGSPAQAVPSWRFATVPAAAFLLQEYAERLAYHGHIVWGTISEPAVVVGVLLQVPCGVVILFVLRLLLRVVHGAGLLLAARLRPRAARLRSVLLWTTLVERASLVALARGAAERAPPRSA